MHRGFLLFTKVDQENIELFMFKDLVFFLFFFKCTSWVIKLHIIKNKPEKIHQGLCFITFC